MNWKNRLINFKNSSGAMIMAICPMSKEIVNSTIEFANKYEMPVGIIPSRRQVDSSHFGGGYVNSWNTKDFVDYIRSRDKGNYIFIERDHGGPYQNPIEKKMSLSEAMESAKKSYEEDIRCGFDIIHIDPSIDPNQDLSLPLILERVFELYSFCCVTAKKYDKEILIEIGTEEQSGKTNKPESFNMFTKEIISFCDKNDFPKPFFIVGQAGTLVKETRNVGTADSLDYDLALNELVEICNKNDIFLKVHNCDYLNAKTFTRFANQGVHSMNIGPEFGVLQTKSYFDLISISQDETLAEQFINLAYNSHRWEKWVISNLTIFEKAIISGHYVFSEDLFKFLLINLSNKLVSKKIDVDSYIKSIIEQKILDLAISCKYFNSSYNWRNANEKK